MVEKSVVRILARQMMPLMYPIGATMHLVQGCVSVEIMRVFTTMPVSAYGK